MKRHFNRISGAVAALALVCGLVGPHAVFAATSPTLTATSGYSILGASTVTCTGATTVVGNVGVAAGTAITGFPTPCTVSPGTTQSNTASAIAAQAENLSTFGALDQACDHTYGAQDLTALSPLGPGVYCSTSTFSLSGNLALTGSGVWIFKTVAGLSTSPGSSVTGGDPCNIWWRVGSSAVINTTTNFEGNILALTDISLQNGATLNGRAMVQTGQVTMDANTVSGPTCSVATPASTSSRPPGTITVIKKVINDNGGTKTIADFPLFVNGTPVVSGETNSFVADPNPYAVTETSDAHYTRTFSGDCDVNGRMNLNPGYMKVCIVTNDDIGAPVATPPVPPLIDVIKVPSPLALPGGPGNVTYSYTLRNIGTVPVTGVTMVGDTCSPITLVSGDMNGDGKLDVNETWAYTCSTNLTETHTNTVVATGWANGISATDLASATVVVGVPVIPPLIHITKVPSPLTLPAGGGMVTYTKQVTNPGTVALNNVNVTDDTCAPVQYVSGDANGDSKLDSSETWTYTCQMRLAKTTSNTAIATGEANGLTVRDFAIATVVVAAAPLLPKTGADPANGILAVGAVAAGILAVSLLLYVVRKKQTA